MFSMEDVRGQRREKRYRGGGVTGRREKIEAQRGKTRTWEVGGMFFRQSRR